ncbi:MAG: tetratricopeptide repeat protein [Candidatus Azobacteroides pseudotrichonymphae]|jgi:tetratricopeptide (TPR) repeat protein|nr:MAG: tetratricopeptide repeat protein [Candidatus Azobacteroides pseudotrichonymphae]
MGKETETNNFFSTKKEVSDFFFKTGWFLGKYFKRIFIIMVIIIVIVVSSIIFYESYLISREKSAEIAFFSGQNYFSNQQWGIALNGDSTNYIGFLGIIEEFRGTKSANLAKAYAGICQYQLGNYKESLKILKSYSNKDQLFASQIIGAIGDCEVNLGNIKEGIVFFQKAAIKACSSSLSPIYLKKAAIAYESLKDYKSALEIYKTIKINYPQFLETNAIEKNIERAKAKL